MQYLDLAIKIAGQSKDKKQFYMACVARRADGAVIWSVNHAVSAQRIPEHHAEVRALRKCDVGSVLYVARVLKDKTTIAPAKPCENCQSFIKNNGVKKVYFTIGPTAYGTWEPSKDFWVTYEL